MNKIKNFIDFINEGFLIKKETSLDPTKFKLRVVRSSFSDDYATIEYTIDGKKWNSIKRCMRDIGYSIYTMYRLTTIVYQINFNKSKEEQFKYELEKFSSYEKIKQYEEEQQKECEEKNASLIRQQKELEDKKKKFYD
jgi:hypothetical protein